MEWAEIDWHDCHLVQAIEDGAAHELVWHVSYPSPRPGYFRRMTIRFSNVFQYSVTEDPSESNVLIRGVNEAPADGGNRKLIFNTSTGTREIVCQGVDVFS